MRRTLFVIHVVTSALVLGGLAAMLVLLVATDPLADAAGFGVLQQAHWPLAWWLVIPNIAASILSGVMLLLYRVQLLERRWMFVKIVATILLTGIATTHLPVAAVEMAIQAREGLEAAALAVLGHEATNLAITAVILAALATVLSVIRPKLGGKAR